MTKLILALDTSTSVTAIGLYSVEGDPLWLETRPSNKRHGEELLPRIQAGLSELDAQTQDVQRLVVGIGPGSFTGLRIGISTAQGWALALNTPVLGVLSPLGIAAPLLEDGAATVAVLGDAFKGEVALSLWASNAQGHPQPLMSPRSCTPEAAALLLNELDSSAPLTVVGDGFRRHADAVTNALTIRTTVAPAAHDTPSPTALVAHALRIPKGADPWDARLLAPSYVRDADAQLPARPLKL